MAVPLRKEVEEKYTWDLKPLFASRENWLKLFESTEKNLDSFAQYRGKLGTSVDLLKEAVESYLEFSRTLEKMYTYAHLMSDTDTADSDLQGLRDSAFSLYARFSTGASFFTPELMSVPDKTLEEYLASPKLAPYKRFIQEMVRYKPHTLSDAEEKLLALGAEVFSAPGNIFNQLNNADLAFGEIEVDGRSEPITHATIGLFLKNVDRNVRRTAYEQFNSVFDAHKNTIATTLGASLKRDVFFARARKFDSALQASLFADNVPQSVYDNLIASVTDQIERLHSYFRLRSKVLGLSDAQIYDTYVPLVPESNSKISYEEASSILVEAFRPLGDEYVDVLGKGLREQRWVDVFENKGKRSGAYCSGCYDSPPYVLMNYKDTNINDVFTLAHELGHALHAYHSRKTQSYQDHGNAIFVAEVASTFNEQLLTEYLLKYYKDKSDMTAYILNHEIDDIKGTFFRQTMFAEFEKDIHARVERHEPVTIDLIRKIYRTLLEKYFGSAVSIHPLADLEALRIPHFYHAFYVYKYATGISAAAVLAQRVYSGDKVALGRYMQFLKAGCTKYPLELLRDAGVDLTRREAIDGLLNRFSTMLGRLEKCLIK